MFPIDRSLLPSLTTRRALIVVDPQNDFLAEDGALPMKMPPDLPERIANLATSLRQGGDDIIWVCSRFEKSRSSLEEQILPSDRSSYSRSPDVSRGRRKQTPPQTNQQLESPEAFLAQESPGQPKCVRPGTSGAEIHPTIKGAVGPRDFSIVKSHYSAFRSEHLLRLLRMRLVTELFICGSVTNISVMATAIDAASHGYTITLVNDCCGYNAIAQHRNSLKQISNMTGCEVLLAGQIVASLKPKPKSSRRPGDRPATSPAGGYSTVRRAGEEDNYAASSASDLLSSFENLSLNSQRAADVIPRLQQNSDDHDSQTCGHTDHISQISPRDDKASVTPQDSETSHQPDKKDKPSVSDSVRLKSDESTSPAEESDSNKPSPIENTTNSSGAVSEPSNNEKHIARIERPLEGSNTKVDQSRTMASEVKPRECEPLCEGDTKVVYDVLPHPLSENIFQKVRDEVRWQSMSHQGGEVPRLVAVQGEVEEDGSMPIYRHPSDESPPLLPFSPTVLEIKKVIEKQLGHPLNHVLIQFYRHGNDYISEHSDKTLDIAKGSYIANVSLGAERVMVLRTKRQPKHKNSVDGAELSSPETKETKRQIQRAPLPHNSLFQMGLQTNMRWLHGIRQDKRLDREKTQEELAYDGGRISLTFRRIGTFLDGENKLIWGQGATSKTREHAKPVINGQTPEAIRMLQCFGRENQSTEFNWDEYYGAGFDVLHLTAAARLFLSPDPLVNMRVQLMLAEYGIGYARGSMSSYHSGEDGKPSGNPPIKFVDNDSSKTAVHGEFEIMEYLQRQYGPENKDTARNTQEEANRYQEARTLLGKQELPKEDLDTWDNYAAEGNDFIAGNTMTLADFVFWPILHEAVGTRGQDVFEQDGCVYENLKKYYERLEMRDSVTKVLAVSR
ncbi:uncharacterized protein F4812DRAFT_451077 [Daldinia caldariorum]|uniref:uncharacterized protein n=1 Tax=Daldinia caldariorum TaxID=326644 RepID=UPI0020073C7E|nr:uncharacterized protein F4812DRAFT_451077 [Daldinia caldariorum]KAI1467779.1 hypothetical protein F4812DRAFT_451077 [Daldinia caldariorum]